MGSGECHWPLIVCGRSLDTVTIAHSCITHIFAEDLKHVVAVVHVASKRAYFKKGCLSFLLQVWIQQNHCDDSKVLGCSFAVVKIHFSLR